MTSQAEVSFQIYGWTDQTYHVGTVSALAWAGRLIYPLFIHNLFHRLFQLAQPVQNVPVQNGPMAVLSRTVHPNNFSLDTALPCVLSNTLATCEVDRMDIEGQTYLPNYMHAYIQKLHFSWM